MELTRKNWSKNDINTFNLYLESLKNKNKIEWTKRIVNTNMKVLAIKTPILKKIANEIYKGNYIEFLSFMPLDYYESTIIIANIINKIKNNKKYYLDIYSRKIDNWASCDVLNFNNVNKEEYYNISLEYIKSKETFVRRIGIKILFSFVKDCNYTDKIFAILDKLYNENEYYVNMIMAWLLCELFIYQREKTLNYLKDSKLNSFVINKAISKCRDSYRINNKDKQLLLNYKR